MRKVSEALGVRNLTRLFVLGWWLVYPASAAFAQTLPDGPGKQTFEDTCSLCHSPTTVIGMHKTKAEWKSKVTEMLQEQDVSDSDRTAIIDYLFPQFPRDSQRKQSAAKDLETILAQKTPPPSCNIANRKAPSRRLEDLKKVPGIDPAKLEAVKSKLEFQ